MEAKEGAIVGKRIVPAALPQNAQADNGMGIQGQPLPHVPMSRWAWRMVLLEKLQRRPMVVHVEAIASMGRAERGIEKAATQTPKRTVAVEIGARRTAARALGAIGALETNEASDGLILPYQPEQMARVWNAERGHQRRGRSLIPADEELRLELVR